MQLIQYIMLSAKLILDTELLLGLLYLVIISIMTFLYYRKGHSDGVNYIESYKLLYFTNKKSTISSIFILVLGFRVGSQFLNVSRNHYVYLEWKKNRNWLIGTLFLFTTSSNISFKTFRGYIRIYFRQKLMFYLIYRRYIA